MTLNSPRNLVEDNLLVGNGPFSGVSLVGNSDDNVVAKNRARTTTTSSTSVPTAM